MESSHIDAEPSTSPGVSHRTALMRSRFSAFALGLGPYLVDTLATTHPDRALPRAALARELSRVRITQRFTGLWILHATGANRDRDAALACELAGGAPEIVHVNQIDLPVLETRFAEQAGIRAAYY